MDTGREQESMLSVRAAREAEALDARVRSRGIRLHQLRSVVVVSVPAEVRRAALAALRQMSTARRSSR